MEKKFLLFLALFCFCSACSAQNVHGKVIDSASGKPLAGVSVYVNGSYAGATTATDGTFQFNVSQLKLPVIVSCIGYQTQTVEGYAGKELVVTLKPKKRVLHEVTIGYNAKSREEEMRIFLREFIGSTSKKDCIIENPDDINFTFYKKKDSLVATVDKPLIIINKKLGYKITYFLESFNYTPGTLFYNGNFFFQEDTATLAAKEIKTILRRRDEAYFGSRMHFIRALWSDDLKNNGFEMIRYVDTPLLVDSVVVKVNGDLYFYPKTNIFISYEGHKSSVKSTTPRSASYITANGYFNGNIAWQGEMSSSRVNMLLPFEFKPSRSRTGD